MRARAQFIVRSWLSWRTIETEHFAFHYPVELETWTRAVAARAEAIDSAVSGIVGYAPPRKTHVVVDDPYQTANGSAWPFLDRPIINLWASSPGPRDDVGEFSMTWGEMLLSHEFAHIAHLTRPSRNEPMRRLWRALPVDLGPVALRAPRWAIEGYATYVEGRVTGSGRPHGAWRPAFLRQWALEGQLPRYEQLNTWGAYAGGEFAYLAGSAFLEWLAQQQGDSSLAYLWRRLSARQNRGFDAAFAGVFGESPRALYARFMVDLTAKSVDAARLIRAAGADTGTIEQRLAWGTGDPAISANGERIALVVRSATRPSRVVIWKTAPEPDTGRARRDSLLKRSDPEDVPGRSIYPPPKKEIATLRSSGGAPYEGPRFLRDGRVLLWRSTPRGDGSLVTDLYIWDLERRSIRRVTHDASVRDADPSPDGRSAFATRCLRGWCDLVSVDLIDGSVTTMAEGSPQRSFYRPRARPGGGDVLVSVHDSGRWQLAIYTSASRGLTMLAPTDNVNRYDGAWVTGETIVDVAERGGVPNLEMLDLGALDKARPLTRVTGAAVAPEPGGARGIWFLSLYSRGYDLRRIDAGQVNDSVANLSPGLSPAALAPATPVAFATNAVSEPKPFGVARRMFRWIPQPAADADGVGALLGLVSRDLIGRLELLADIAFGDRAAWRGVATSALWRGTRPAIRAEAFIASQDLTRTRSPVPGPPGPGVRLAGVVASIDDARQFDAWASRYRVGAAAGRARSLASSADARDSSGSRSLVFADAAVAWTQRGDLASLTEAVGGHVSVGRSFDTRFERSLATLNLSLSGPAVPSLSAGALYGRTNDDATLFEQFSLGGGPSALVDRMLLTQRITMPALPSAISVGSSVFTYRAALGLPPLSWYLWSGSTARAGERFTAWHRVIGVELATAFPAIAAAGTPAARMQLGLGESLDAPFRHRVRAYASLMLNP